MPGAAFECEFRFVRPDGRIVWVLGQCLQQLAHNESDSDDDDLAPDQASGAAARPDTPSAAATATAALKPGTHVRAMIGAFTDITHLKQLESERLAALQEAASVQDQRTAEAESHRREQERFVDVICHEIRNPLNGIVNNVDLLRTNWSNMRDLVLKSEAQLPAHLRAALLRTLDDDNDMLRAIELCATHQVLRAAIET